MESPHGYYLKTMSRIPPSPPYIQKVARGPLMLDSNNIKTLIHFFKPPKLSFCVCVCVKYFPLSSSLIRIFPLVRSCFSQIHEPKEYPR